MEYLIYLLVAAVLIALALVAADRHLCLKDVERDLKEYLGDIEVARNCCHFAIRIHFDAQVYAIKALIRRHFKL